jgi:MFS family permease
LPNAPASGGSAPGRESSPEVGGPYARYVLGVLVLVYVLNFLDRQIISILAEDIKADLGMSDSQIGFLYGTAFAVFYAIFGIPLGRLADVWQRRSLIALGLAFWSAMTAVSGLARTFTQLASARIGVGVGEASATPAAFSMLSDSFSPRSRATVLAIYSSGIYIGAGLGLGIGGQIVDRWNAAFTPETAPLGLAGWQAAYLAVGIPGVLLAFWVRSLNEPRRGAADGIFTPPEPHPFRSFLFELRAVVPPFTAYHLWRTGASRRTLVMNGAIAAGVAAVATWLIHVTGDLAQWTALGVGLYAAASWAQGLALRDRPAAALLFGTPSLRWVCLGFSCLAFAGYGFGGWTPPFFMRIHDQDPGTVGVIIGATAAVAGFVGVTAGGFVADRLRASRPGGRLAVGIVAAILPVPLALWMLATENTTTAYVINAPLTALQSMWIGAGASTVQDLVLPRMRAVASAFYILVITFVGLALGPYTVGAISDAMGDLTQGLRWSLLISVFAVTFLVLALRHLERDEASLHDRARGAGETLDDPGMR